MNSKLLKIIIKHYGSQRKLARALCVTEGAVSHWVRDGYFPPGQAIRIERAMKNSSVRAVDMVTPDKVGE